MTSSTYSGYITSGISNLMDYVGVAFSALWPFAIGIAFLYALWNFFVKRGGTFGR